MNRNFVEMLSALCAAQAEFLVVGGWAVTVHGFTRYTGDFDVWVRADQANSHRVYAALAAFGATLGELDRAELAVPGIVYQMGLPPQHIDIITELEGVDFEGAWSRRMMVQLGGLDVPIIGLDDLIANKRATGRAKDLLDVAELEAIRARSTP